MEEKAVEKTNFLKKGGVSLPPLLILLLSFYISYLVYPHQAPKTQAPRTVISKQTKAKISSFAIHSSAIKGNTNSSTPTPTPTNTQVATVPQGAVQPTNIPTAAPTQTPSANNVPHNDNEPNAPTPVQKNANDNTAPAPKPTETPDNNTNLSLAGVGGNVNQIVPVVVSILGSTKGNGDK